MHCLCTFNMNNNYHLLVQLNLTWIYVCDGHLWECIDDIKIQLKRYSTSHCLHHWLDLWGRKLTWCAIPQIFVKLEVCQDMKLIPLMCHCSRHNYVFFTNILGCCQIYIRYACVLFLLSHKYRKILKTMSYQWVLIRTEG